MRTAKNCSCKRLFQIITGVRVCAAHFVLDIGKEPRGLNALTKLHKITHHSVDRLPAEAVNMYIYKENVGPVAQSV